MALHRLPADGTTVRVGVIDAAHPPVLTIDDGDEVVMETWSHWGGQVVPGTSMEELLQLREAAPLGPHSITGPIHIEGAAPGDWLRIEVLELRTGPVGFNLALPAPLGRGVLAPRFPEGSLRHLTLDRDAMTTELLPGVTIALRPFLGIMGVAPEADGAHSSVPPGPFGGNLDLKELAVGSTLFLPIFRHGAGFYAGDAHAAQGDGEVNQTAIETSMEAARLRFGIVKSAESDSLPRVPWAETATHLVAMGLDEDLDQAVVQAVDCLVTHVSHRFDIAPVDAYALVSLAADVEVTQAVNRVKGAHALLPWTSVADGARDAR